MSKSETPLGFCLLLGGIWGALIGLSWQVAQIAKATDRQNSIILCVESWKLDLAPESCVELLSRKDTSQ